MAAVRRNCTPSMTGRAARIVVPAVAGTPLTRDLHQ
jgi:hypothetical protein